MVRRFQSIWLTRPSCLGLREAIRPLAETSHSPRLVVDFCRRLYLALHSLEADPDREAADLSLSEDEVMVINNFVSAQDGDWAADVLLQTRQVLFELTTGREAIQLVSAEEAEKLFVDLAVPGQNLPASGSM